MRARSGENAIRPAYSTGARWRLRRELRTSVARGRGTVIDAHAAGRVRESRRSRLSESDGTAGLGAQDVTRDNAALGRRAQIPAYAAFVWSVVFILPHACWAAGGSAGLEDEPIEGTLAVINYAAIVLSVVSAVLALALVRPWGASVPRRLLLVGAWGACLLLSLRGGAGLIQDVAIVVGGSDEDVPAVILVFEPLFLLGGILFGLAARQYRLTPRRS